MTPYSKIFKAFLTEVQDDSFRVDTSIPEQVALVTDDLTSLLHKSLVKFSYPKMDLRAHDDDLQEFEEDLDLEEIEILATGMVVAWALRENYNMDIMRPTMTTKDFTTYAQAPHLRALSHVALEAEKRHKRMLIKYSIRNKDYTNRIDRWGV